MKATHPVAGYTVLFAKAAMERRDIQISAESVEADALRSLLGPEAQIESLDRQGLTSLLRRWLAQGAFAEFLNRQI